MKTKKSTIIRTVLFVIALINSFMSTIGKSPIPIDDETITALISWGFSAITGIWAWWKNNSFTKAAKAGDMVKDAIKSGELSGDIRITAQEIKSE